MHYELVGSFMAYAVAVAMIAVRSFYPAIAIAVLSSIVAICFLPGGVLYATIISGTILARTLVEMPKLEISRTATVIGLAAISFVLCGYDRPVGFYQLMSAIDGERTQQAAHGIAAFMIVTIALFHSPTKKWLGRGLFVLLGRLSFPLYLVHLPILFAAIYPLNHFLAGEIGSLSIALSFIVFVAASLAASYPLALLDEWWVRRLGRMAELIAFQPKLKSAPVDESA
jgi:peptidoglycan/LPS O-acetylase OafA/YrhL